MSEFQSPEEVRKHIGLTQMEFAGLLGMPVRTYEDKRRRGFRRVDLLAAKFVFCKWSGGEPVDASLEHLSPYQ